VASESSVIKIKLGQLVKLRGEHKKLYIITRSGAGPGERHRHGRLSLDDGEPLAPVIHEETVNSQTPDQEFLHRKHSLCRNDHMY